MVIATVEADLPDGAIYIIHEFDLRLRGRRSISGLTLNLKEVRAWRRISCHSIPCRHSLPRSKAGSCQNVTSTALDKEGCQTGPPADKTISVLSLTRSRGSAFVLAKYTAVDAFDFEGVPACVSLIRAINNAQYDKSGCASPADKREARRDDTRGRSCRMIRQERTPL